jgi:hypothetical protein
MQKTWAARRVLFEPFGSADGKLWRIEPDFNLVMVRPLQGNRLGVAVSLWHPAKAMRISAAMLTDYLLNASTG